MLEMKIYVHRKSYTERFLAVLFIEAPNWKQTNTQTNTQTNARQIVLHSGIDAI